MRNILSRTKFKKINEDSASVKDVVNVEPSANAIKGAWNTSVIGAISNTIIGGTINNIYKFYKWGQRGNVRVTLLSRLHKEYLKGLVYYSDKNNIDLKNGILSGDTKESEIEIQGSQKSQPSQVQDKRASAIQEMKELLPTINSLDEMKINEKIKEWLELYKKFQSEIQIYKDNKDGSKNATETSLLRRIKEAKNIQEREKLEKIYKNWLKQKEEWNKDWNQILEIKSMIDNRIKELGGDPDNFKIDKSIEEIKKERAIKEELKKKKEKLKSLKPMDWEPTSNFDFKYGDFMDYEEFEKLPKSVDTSNLSVGDKFKYFSKNKETEATVGLDNKGNKTFIIDGASIKIDPNELLPKGFPNLIKSRKKIKNFLYEYVNDYDSMTTDQKDKFLQTYQAYLVISKIYEKFSVRHKKYEKTNENYLLIEKIEDKKELVGKSKKIKSGKADFGIKGGDIEGNLKISDFFTKKEQDKLIKTDTDIRIQEIAIGKISNLIENTEKLSKNGVSQEVNKYNLELIRLVADKTFVTENQKKKWQERVNSAYAFWQDILDINEVDILKGISFATIKKDDATRLKSEIDGVYNYSALQTSILGNHVPVSGIKSNMDIIILLEYSNNIFTLPGRESGLNLDMIHKKAVRISTNLASKDLGVKEQTNNDEEKNTKVEFVSKPDSVRKYFASKEGTIYINNDAKSIDNVKTYFLFDTEKTKVPKDLNSSKRVDIYILNEISWKDGAEDRQELFIFDPNKRDNISITNDKLKKGIPKVKVSLKHIAEAKNSNSKTYDAAFGNLVGREDYIISKTDDIIKMFREYQKNKEIKK